MTIEAAERGNLELARQNVNAAAGVLAVHPTVLGVNDLRDVLEFLDRTRNLVDRLLETVEREGE